MDEDNIQSEPLFPEIEFPEPQAQPSQQEVPLEAALQTLQRYGINPLQQQAQVAATPDPIEVAEREAREAFDQYQAAQQSGNYDLAAQWAQRQQDAQNRKLRLETVREATESTRVEMAAFQNNLRVQQVIGAYRQMPGYNYLGKEFERKLAEAVKSNPLQFSSPGAMENAARMIYGAELVTLQQQQMGKKGTVPPVGGLSQGDAKAVDAAKPKSPEDEMHTDKDRWGNTITFKKVEWDNYYKVVGEGGMVDF